MKRMRRIWKQTRWGLLNCKFERINTIMHVTVITTIRRKIYSGLSNIPLNSFSSQNIGMAKELISSKSAGHTFISSFFPVFPCPVARGTDSTKPFFLSGKGQHSHTGPSRCSVYLCLNPVSWYESGLSPLQGSFVVFPRTKISQACNIGCKCDENWMFHTQIPKIHISKYFKILWSFDLFCISAQIIFGIILTY